MPPSDLDLFGEFRPAPELAAWAHAAFIDENGPLANPDHAHLRAASIGFLWTNVPNGRHMKAIAATCELGKPQGQGKWAKARSEMQIRNWFGGEPDFIITVWTGYALVCDDVEWLALIEHELSHAGQDQDEFGAPKFKKSGAPCFAIKGHDFEEFVGVVRRYGATSPALREAVSAINRGPEIGDVRITRACGTCNRKAA